MKWIPNMKIHAYNVKSKRRGYPKHRSLGLGFVCMKVLRHYKIKREGFKKEATLFESNKHNLAQLIITRINMYHSYVFWPHYHNIQEELITTCYNKDVQLLSKVNDNI